MGENIDQTHHMIFIERSAQPNWFRSPEVQKVFKKQKEFMLESKNRQEIHTGRFDKDQFTLPMDEGMEEKLIQIFKNKCPFCESLVMGSNAAFFTPDIVKCRHDLEQLLASKQKGAKFEKGMTRGFNSYYGEETKEGFEAYDIGFLRPELRAMNANGAVSPAHYWWLGWDWHNLFLICRSCQTAKENKFPIEASTRASFLPDQDLNDLRRGLDEEKALLIDPCQKHNFEKRHILFKQGKALGVDEIGQQTINVFKLNRPRLVASRQFISKAISEEIEMMFRGDRPTKEVLSPSHPFVAATLDHWWLNSAQDAVALDHCRAIFQGDLPPYYRVEATTATSYTEDKISDIEQEQQAVEEKINSYDLEKKENLAAYFTKSLWIEKVVLTNFKAFEELTLDFPDTSAHLNTRQLKTDTSRPWLALLGENGVGKSSISQAIALTLMGKSKLQAMDLELNEFIRFDQPKAKVEVYLLNREDPIVLEIIRNEEGGTFTLNEETPQVLMMAYGATRLPSKEAMLGQDEHSFIRTSNLFDPNAKLGNGFKWLGDEDQVPEAIFAPLREGLNNLLQLENGQEIKRDPLKKELYLEEEVLGVFAEAVNDSLKGQKSINIYGLNRAGLVWARTREALNLQNDFFALIVSIKGFFRMRKMESELGVLKQELANVANPSIKNRLNKLTANLIQDAQENQRKSIEDIQTAIGLILEKLKPDQPYLAMKRDLIKDDIQKWSPIAEMLEKGLMKPSHFDKLLEHIKPEALAQALAAQDEASS